MTDVILYVNRNQPDGADYIVINSETAKNLVMLAASHETGPNSFAKVIFSSGEKITIGPVAEQSKTTSATTYATSDTMRNVVWRTSLRCVDCGQEKCSCPKMASPNTNWTSQILPAAPTDDEATEENDASETIVSDIIEATHPDVQYANSFRAEAREVIAAIRRGEVHGLPSPDEHAALKAEVERLRAESSNHAAEAETMRRERDAAIAMAMAAESECEYDQRNAAMSQAESVRLLSELDTARAAHAEAMLKLKDVTKWAEGLIRQLPAGHNGRDSWLLNYGTGYDVEEMRDKHPTYRAKHQNKDASK